jgi:hypothetical protein
MSTAGRHPDQHFTDDEHLYRRFSPDSLDGDEISIAAVGLPDMSVMRQKYTDHPGWVLIDENDAFADWGVLAFLVGDIPPREEVLHEGVIAYELRPRHVPHRYNYPHSEVWVFRDEVHICTESDNLHLLERDFELRWRERIVLASHIVVQLGGED